MTANVAGASSVKQSKQALPEIIPIPLPLSLRIPQFVENLKRSSKRGRKAALPKTPTERTPTRSHLEIKAAWALQAHQLTGFVEEYKFHPTRLWRFDLAFVDKMVAVECEGGTWVQGRHSRGSGIEGDLCKYNEAALLGWKVIRVTEKHIRTGEMVEWVKRAIGG